MGHRKKTSSDIRGMFGGSDSDDGNLASSQRCMTRRGRSSKQALSPMAEKTGHSGKHIPAATPEAPTTSGLPDMPISRRATTPGQFRKTSYDPFSCVLAKEAGSGGSSANVRTG